MNAVRLLLAKGALPVVLITAVMQGWVLYALHLSVKNQSWPATDSAWLLALYSLAVFIPVALQMLAAFTKTKSLWIVLAALSAAYFYFGWHVGRVIYVEPQTDLLQSAKTTVFDSDEFAQSAFTLLLLSLLLLPFIQVRLSTGRWAVNYSFLFTTAWRNKLMLAEAALFTGLFWLILALWQMLFKMLGIDFFKELFEEPIFFYPVTTIAFGIALHLIGSVERLTEVILEQLLSVLKWLAIVAGILLSLFTLALLFKLPGLVFEGQKAIGAAWLLWLVTVIVLLINAAYRDGSTVEPYPKWIALGLRCVVPLTIVISATALYSLVVRARHYGITVERLFALIVAAAALMYSVGYALAAVRKGRWMQGIGRVNVIVAVAMIVVIAATLTPLLSPHRLAANSQYRQVLESPANAAGLGDYSTSYHYLQFASGRYGRERLRELSELRDHPDAERIRLTSRAALQLSNRWERLPVDANLVIERIVLFPPKSVIDAELREKLIASINDPSTAHLYPETEREMLGGLFVDLHGDSIEEFVLIHGSGGDVYQRIGTAWERRGTVDETYTSRANRTAALGKLAEGQVVSKVPEWKDFKIGDQEFRVVPSK